MALNTDDSELGPPPGDAAPQAAPSDETAGRHTPADHRRRSGGLVEHRPGAHLLGHPPSRRYANCDCGGFVAAIIVFWLNRRRNKGILAWLAIAGLVIVSGSAIAGLLLDSEKAYLANDPIGDGITVLVALGSVLIGRPIVGYIACEVFPRATSQLHATDRVFVQITLLLAAKDLITGGARVAPRRLDTDGYLLFSRVVSWPLNALFFYAAYRMTIRANRGERLAAPRGSSARKAIDARMTARSTTSHLIDEAAALLRIAPAALAAAVEESAPPGRAAQRQSLHPARAGTPSPARVRRHLRRRPTRFGVAGRRLALRADCMSELIA